MADDEKELLREINTRFQEWSDIWKPLREEGKKDILCVAGDVLGALDPKGKEQREKYSRPRLDLDELNQYTNQLINDARTHPRAVKVAPRGFGANDKTSALRADKIREIEYRSNSQMVYTTMFQNTVERSYGFFRVNSRWEPGQWKQELWDEPIVNPDLITPDPWSVHPDGSDMRGCFEHEFRDAADFKEGGEFSGATITNFGDGDVQKMAPGWIRDENKIQVANYWKLKTKKRTLYALKHPSNPNGKPVPMWKDLIPKKDLAVLKADGSVLDEREEDDQSVCKYLTNGVEILKTTEWPGRYIPIVCCLGKILYVDDGSGAERRILSLIRLARDPFMLYCYYRMSQAEMAGMIPKVPVMVYKGQLAGLEFDWQKAPHEPLAFLEVHAKTEATEDQILPLPQRLAYEAGAHLQALELCAEGARRAIQAAMGAYALPTTAQRHNEKSGVALQEIKENTQIGNFHFLQHYDDAIRHGGIIKNDLLRYIHDTDDPIMVRTMDGKSELRDVNSPQGVSLTQGEHDVTISTGPSLDSERDSADQLADSLIGNKEVLAIIGPQKAVKLLATVVKMRNPGTAGELMAAIIDPPSDGSADPQQMAQQLGMAKEHIAQLTQVATVMKHALDAKLIEQQGKVEITKIQEGAETERADKDREAKLAVAELQALARQFTESIKLFMEERGRIGAQAHDTATAAADAGHEQIMADQQHQQAQELAAQQATHASELATQQAAQQPATETPAE